MDAARARMPTDAVREFVSVKVRALSARARRLATLDPESVGIRPQDRPYAPAEAHFAAANRRLAQIDEDVRRHLAALSRTSLSRELDSPALLAQAALVEREVDRARRAFGLFFDVFSQRGSRFGPALAACDAIAADCFAVVRQSLPGLLPPVLVKPLTYLEYNFSPATFRRGVLLGRLLGERNPFPLVRVPYERIESPWGMGVLLHEVAHNLQADLGIWNETENAVRARVLRVSGDTWLTRIWARLHKEIFADAVALLLGGPASARTMKDFLAYPPRRVLSFRPLSSHPMPYLRVFLLAEMLRRMGFTAEAARTEEIWRALYDRFVPGARAPHRLLETAPRLIPHVIDEVVFQPRRGLAQHAVVDAIPFRASDERAIQAAGVGIAGGRLPRGFPPRFAPSAARWALERRVAAPEAIARTVLGALVNQGGRAARAASHPTKHWSGATVPQVQASATS